jgi:predicted GIY-YIG superfamily endonuclease
MQSRLFADAKPLVERLGRDFFLQLPQGPGVYLMRDRTAQVLYVGKAKNLRKRVCSYRVANPERMARRTLRLLRLVENIDWEICTNELTAIRRESELLLSLKPRFNRAGVWQPPNRYLNWRIDGNTLALAISETPAVGWRVFGPFGSGLVYLRAALVRLLWYALHPDSGAATMPEGWMHGRLGAVVTPRVVESCITDVKTVLEKLFEGSCDEFSSWIGDRTKSLLQTYDLEMRDADLELVGKFMKSKAHRTLPLATPTLTAVDQGTVLDFMLPFMDEPQ